MKRTAILLALLLPGCAALPALGPGLMVADAIAKSVCAAILGAQSPTDALAKIGEIEQRIVDAQIEAAAARGADKALLDAAREVLAATKATQRAAWQPIAAAAGEKAAPVKLQPCPVAPPPAIEAPKP